MSLTASSSAVMAFPTSGNQPAPISPERDRETVVRFLRLLDPAARDFTFQTFDDDRCSGHTPNGRLARDTSDRNEVIHLYALGAGVFVTINETDLTGRKSENIKRIRAVWQEDDEGHGGPFPLPPSLVVESSPGHFHRYWLTADDWPADEQGRADFAAVMERMVASYGSDKNAKDISRVLRLPGFLHRKDATQPHMVGIVEDSGRRYTRAEIIRAFPPIEREKPKPQVRSEWHANNCDEERIADALRAIPADDRDVWLQIGMALKDELGDGGRSIWDSWSATCPDKFKERDQDKTWRSFRRNGIGIGTLFHHAKKHGWPRGPLRGNGKATGAVDDENNAEDDAVTLPLGIVCAGAAAAAPAPKLIDGLLSTTGLCFVGGQSSAGKSFIAISMAVALATWQPFFGRAVREKVGTLIIAAEGRQDMQARVAAAKKHIGVEGDLPILWMAVPVSWEAFLKDLDHVNAWMKAKHNVRLGAVMLDTVSASFDLKEEDDNAEAARVCKVLRRIGEHVGGVVVPIHHYGKDPSRGLRGASAWTANADMALAVNAEIAPDGTISDRRLAVMKDRSGAQGPVAAFDLVSVELVTGDGEVFTNLAVSPIEVSLAAATSRWNTNALRNLKHALDEVLPAHGRDESPYADGPMVRIVDSDVLKAEFIKINVVDSDTPEKMAEAQRKAYTRTLKAAQDRALIQVKNKDGGGQIVWLARPLGAAS